MSGISTHVLDLARGRPAAGVVVRLSKEAEGDWAEIAVGATDADGRVKNLLPSGEPLSAGRYRLRFETGEYHRVQGSGWFHPYIEVVFEVGDSAQNYHVPLLLTAYGYSTYRGS
jgi:5-hydroxyisourate hydrolase